MRGTDNASVANASASSATPFALVGGAYVLDAVATWGGGSVALHRLMPDGTTYALADSTATLSANGTTGAFAIPPGLYKFIIATATAVYATVQRVPGE